MAQNPPLYPTQTLQTGSSHFAPLPRGSKKNGAKVVGATSSVEFSSCWRFFTLISLTWSHPLSETNTSTCKVVSLSNKYSINEWRCHVWLLLEEWRHSPLSVCSGADWVVGKLFFRVARSRGMCVGSAAGAFTSCCACLLTPPLLPIYKHPIGPNIYQTTTGSPVLDAPVTDVINLRVLCV